MSTLAVVEDVLRETGVPMTVKEIVAHAGARLPSKSKTPDTVVARDLSMDLKKRGEASKFLRPSPGQYTLRCFAAASPVAGSLAAGQPAAAGSSAAASAATPAAGASATPVLSSAMRHERAPTLAARAAGAGRPSRVAGSR
ncbi:MAG: HTH domain-containing protein [Kofleriaceae bacterium]